MTSKNNSEELHYFFNYFVSNALSEKYNPHHPLKGLVKIHNEEASLRKIELIINAKRIIDSNFSSDPVFLLFNRLKMTHSLRETLPDLIQLVNYAEDLLIKSSPEKKTPLELHSRVKSYLNGRFPSKIDQIILTGSAFLKKEDKHFSDTDIVVIVKDKADVEAIKEEAKLLKQVSLNFLDLIVIDHYNFHHLNPTYKYAHLLNLLEFNSYGQNSNFKYLFDETLYFLADFKARVKYLIKEKNSVSTRKMKKNVYFTNVLQSNRYKESMMSLDYETFEHNSNLGKILIEEDYVFSERFKKTFKETLKLIYPTAMDYLQKAHEQKLDLDLVDPFFIPNLKEFNLDWKAAYKKSIDEILFEEDSIE